MRINLPDEARTDSHTRVRCDADIAFTALDIIAIMDPPQIPGAWGAIYSFGYVTGYHCNHGSTPDSRCVGREICRKEMTSLMRRVLIPVANFAQYICDHFGEGTYSRIVNSLLNQVVTQVAR